MLETISEKIPLLTNVIIPLSIVFCLLCGLTTILIFLYWQERCEKGSDVSNSLLVMVTTCHLTSSITSTLVFVSIITQANDSTIFPCFVFNIGGFCEKVQMISTLLLSVIITWRSLWPDHYATIRQCALKRISGLVSVILFTYQIFVNMMTCSKEAFCPQEIMENLLVPEVFFSIQNMLNEMECRMLIGSIFVAASIMAVALATLCLIIKSLCTFFSAKQTISNPEGMELTEAAGNETGTLAQAQGDNASINTSAEKAERQTSPLESKEPSSRRFVTIINGGESDMGAAECDPQEGSSQRDRESVRGPGPMRAHFISRDDSRKDWERESVHGAGRARDAPSLPAFTNTRRLKLSTLVLILYSAFVTFVTQPVILHFSGNIILVKSISLVITSISPLVIVQMEKDILDFVREVVNGEAFN